MRLQFSLLSLTLNLSASLHFLSFFQYFPLFTLLSFLLSITLSINSNSFFQLFCQPSLTTVVYPLSHSIYLLYSIFIHSLSLSNLHPCVLVLSLSDSSFLHSISTSVHFFPSFKLFPLHSLFTVFIHSSCSLFFSFFFHSCSLFFPFFFLS